MKSESSMDVPWPRTLVTGTRLRDSETPRSDGVESGELGTPGVEIHF